MSPFYWRKNMRELWNMLQAMFTGIGGWLGYFLGGCDGLLYALIAFTVIDYISGVMCGIVDGKLSSSVGFKGICRKVVVFMLVGIASILDTRIFQTGSVLRTAVIFFYLSNEGISLLENAAHLGLPIPTVVRKALNQLHDKSENKENENGK
jgi:toxin secretion/phage lysis holin